jgi:hypothetical protein
MSIPRPRPVFCVIEREYRDRAIAEAVSRGRYLHHGVALDLGLEPDWLGAPVPQDREWRLEWSKFYYGLDLAWAFHQTGERRFQETWERLVRSWIRQVPIASDPSDVIGRRVQNWIYAWNGFAACAAFAGLSEGAAEAIVDSLEGQILHLRTHLTRERNHRTLELYALFIAALALPDLDPTGHLLAFAMAELHRNLLADVLPDGVQRERSTHYHHVVLRSFLGARENARRFGLRFPATFDERLARACDFALHCHRPDGGLPAISDSDSGNYSDLLELAAALFARRDWLYAATRGAYGVAPPRGCASFPHGGYFTQRSGWGDAATLFEAERFLLLDCGPIGDGGHGHYDALSVEIAADGRALVVDPGRYTYCDDPPGWRRWFKSTAAHNTVTVDGLDQTPYRRGRPKGPVAAARLLQRLHGPGLDLLWGEVTSPVYDAIHRRRILFVADEYWIFDDLLTATRPHRYELRFHLPPDAHNRVDVREGDETQAVQSSGLRLIFTPPWPIAIKDGWVSARYGFKQRAPVVIATADGVERAHFLTLVAPIDEHARASFRIARHRVADDDMLVAEIETRTASGERRDRVVWSASGRPAEVPGIGRPAAAAWIRSGETSMTAAEPVDVYAEADVGVSAGGALR